MKKILIVIPGNKGTIAMCSRNLYLALKQQNGFEVKCVGIHHFENGLEEFENIEYYKPSGNIILNEIGLLSQIRWLRKIKKEFCPDITISTLFSTSIINVLSGGYGKKIGIFHSPHQQKKEFGKLSYFITLCTYTFIYPHLNILACVSEEVKESLMVFPFTRKKKIQVIYNVHNAENIKDKGYEKIPVKEMELLSHPYVLFCGRLDKNKAPIRALESFANSQKPSDANIIYIGGEENGQLERLIQKAKELGVDEKVHYLGKKANPYIYMKHASALISSSYSEGLPGVMIESLILGTPVVTTNSSKGIWEIFSCSNEYQKELSTNYVTDCGIITPNLSYLNSYKKNFDMQNLADAISVIWQFPKVNSFKFEEKVSAKYICNQIKELPGMQV